MTETANSHEAGDCIVELCMHPVHENEDAVIDLGTLLGDLAFDDPYDKVPVFL